MATKNIDGLKQIKSASKNINEFLLDTTEMIVDETIERTMDWQNLADKAIKGGFKLTKKQADITFKVLETLKKQWKQGQETFSARASS